jgi:hypothetical protein
MLRRLIFWLSVSTRAGSGIGGLELNSAAVGLVPVAALQRSRDDAALDVFEDVEERGIGGVFEQRVLSSCGR